MLLSLLWLAVVCGTTHAKWQGDAIDGRLTLHVRIDQDGGLPEPDLVRAIQQVRQIWGAAGMSVTSGRYANPVPSGSAVISLRIVAERWQRDDRPVLGWVSENGAGTVSPTLFISRVVIRAFLAPAAFRGRPLNQQPQVLLDRLTAQAIGRVAAHELGHYLLQSSKHPDRGLMRPTYSTTDLIEASLKPFEIPNTERPVVRREVAKLAAAQTR